MKVLHVALGMPEFDRAMEAAGHDVVRIDWRKLAGRSPGPYPRAVHAAIDKALASFRPDLVFMQLQRAAVVHPILVEKARKAGAVVMNWCGDVRDPLPTHYIDLGKHVNVTLFTNMPDVEEMRSYGLPCDFLQIGYDPTIYRLPDRPVRREGVIFIGNNYPNTFPESASRLAFCDRARRVLGGAFKMYGNHWPFAGVRMTKGAEEEVEAYWSAEVAVNWDHFNRDGFHSDRLWRAAACGCKIVDARDYGFDVDRVIAAIRGGEAKTVRAETWDERVPDIERLMKVYS